MADADGNERRREHARRQRVEPQLEQEGTPGRVSNTQHMDVAHDAAFELPKRLDEGRRHLATLEAAHRAGDTHAASGAAWMLRAALGSARTLLDTADRSDVERHRASLDALSAAAEPVLHAVQRTLAAVRGVSDSGGSLPFLETIQRSFGRHDVSGVRAHTGGAAVEANHELGARAFAFGGQVAFANTPDLHTAAHEAAHVVQQRSGVALKGTIDQRNDEYEQHADAVADAVVRGESAEELLDRVPAGATAASNTSAIQRKTDRTSAPAPRAPVDARDYFSLHQSKFFDAMRERLQKGALPNPHDRLRWASDSGALLVMLEEEFKTLFGNMYGGDRLPELLYPVDPFALIDRHRALASGQPGVRIDGKLPVGSAEWNPVAGKAIAIELEAGFRSSLPRMGLRFVALADDSNGASSITSDMLVASHPIDLLVARLLCDPGVVRYVPGSRGSSKTKQPSRAMAKDTSRPEAFADGLKLVDVQWQGEHDRKLWNCARFAPADARAEDIATQIWDRGDGVRHTEYAYALVVVPPFVIIPPRWAKDIPQCAAHAPEHVDETSPVSALDLADTDLGDEAARVQAGKRAGMVDRAKLAHTLATAKAQLGLVADRIGPWRLFHHVGPALRWVTKHAESIDAAPDQTLSVWSGIVAGLDDTLANATGDIIEVLDLAEQRGITPGDAAAKPFRDVLEPLATAMGVAHLQQHAHAQLAIGRQRKAQLPLALLEGSLRTTRESAEELSMTGTPSSGPKDAASVANASTVNLEAGAVDLRAKMVSGAGLDADQLEALTIAAAEQALANRLMALESRTEQLIGALDAVSGPGDVELALAFPTRLREIQGTAHSMLETMRALAHPKSIPSDPKQAQKAFADARKSAVANTQRWLAELERREGTKELFERVVRKIEDARIRLMIADIALLIGFSIIGAMAGAWVGGLVRGSMMAGAAVDTLELAQLAARARFLGAAANIVTDAGTNAVLQTSAFGGDTKLSFAENLLSSLMTLGALRPIQQYSKVLGALDEQATGMWKVVSRGRVAFVHVGTITTELLVGAGAGYVASRIAHGERPKDEAQVTSWALQGAAMAVGHFFLRTIGNVQERLGQLKELGAHLEKRAQRQAELAQKLTKDKTPRLEDALLLLEEHERILKEENALLHDEKALARLGLDQRQIATLRAGNNAALVDTQSQAYDTMKLRFLGLEPISANGLVWAGNRAQIELVLADASSAVRTVTPAGDEQWTVEMGGRRVTFVEINHPARRSDQPPTAAEAEIHRAMARRAIEINAQRSKQVTAMIAAEKSPKVKHITLGEGVAGTLSHSTQTHGAGAMPGPLKAMPDAIAISDQPDWWQILGDREIGQPVGEWRSGGYKWQPGAFNHDHENLGRASDLAFANAMTALESGMVSVRGRVTAVEEFTGTESWPVAANWRVKLDDQKWIYSDTIAFAAGLGTPKNLESITANPELDRTLASSGRMVYAQQELVPHVPEGATVLVVGDSGTAGWAAQEAVRNGRTAIVIARDPSLPGVPPHVRKDLETHGVRVVPGEVKTTSFDGERITVGIADTGGKDVVRSASGEGIAIAIGQLPVLPAGVERLHFRMVRRIVNRKERVVALEAYDPVTGDPTGLVVHGAEMTTRPFKYGPQPYVQDREEFAAAIDRQAAAEEVPPYSRGVAPSIHQSAVNVPASNRRSQ